MKEGFSLIEVMVALTLLAVVLLPFLSIVAGYASREHENDIRIEALNLGRATMEKLLSKDEVLPGEITVNGKFIVCIKVNKFPGTGALDELTVVVLKKSDKTVLAELCSLR